MAYIIAEIGQNHNGDLKNALKLIDVAVDAGCDAVKFQKRTVGVGLYNGTDRDTPWGRMKYEDYRVKLELSLSDYQNIDDYCQHLGVDWFCSVWDATAVSWYERYFPNSPFIKIPSAKIRDIELLHAIGKTDYKTIMSTGGATFEEITKAITFLKEPILMHTVSIYPCPVAKLNLRMIMSLKERYGLPTGYSGHETGVPTTVCAVAMGATHIERHITLDHTMWGTDQSASLEPHGLEKLVKDIRSVELALGHGRREILEEEQSKIESIR